MPESPDRASQTHTTVHRTVDHRGVTLLRPRGRVGWRLRWLDPDTGRRTSRSLSADEARTARTRRDAAREQLRQLKARRHELKQGAHRLRDGPALIADVLRPPPGLRPGSVLVYAAVAARFIAYAHKEHTERVRDITPRLLRGFATTRLDGLRPSTVNKELRALQSMLMELRRSGLLSLSRDQIADGLRRFPVAHEIKPILTPDQCRSLLRIASQHYQPAVPLIRFLLLTGMRISEALGIEWRDVHYDEILVRAAVAKGGRVRKVDLKCSPTALSGMRRGDPHERVFGRWTINRWDTAVRRLVRMGAPRFSAHTLRRTCGSYGANSSIHGTAGHIAVAKRLGHSVTISERHYVHAVRVDARYLTYEQALGLVDDMAALAAAHERLRAAQEAYIAAVLDGMDELPDE